jgi:hypothetical protein
LKKTHTHTPPKTSCQAPSARLLARTLNQNKFSLFSFLFSKRNMFFSFSLYMHLMIFRGSDPPKGSAECTTLTTTDRKVITVPNGGREIGFLSVGWSFCMLHTHWWCTYTMLLFNPIELASVCGCPTARLCEVEERLSPSLLIPLFKE